MTGTDKPEEPGWYAFEGSEWKQIRVYSEDGKHEEEGEDENGDLVYRNFDYETVKGESFRTVLFVRYLVIGDRFWGEKGSWTWGYGGGSLFKDDEPTLGFNWSHHPWYNGINGLDTVVGKWYRLELPWEKIK